MSTLILASASGVRARLLREAGVRFGVRPADMDEEDVKKTLRARGVGHEGMASALAEAKASNVSSSIPQSLVLGCDQVLVCGDRLFDKPRDIAEARDQLLSLRGKTHHLVTALVLAKGGKPEWRHEEKASLSMREFSDGFLESYLKSEGATVLSSVGCYQLEGQGAQLFEKVDGDFFAILGLPLIPLLAALRERGILEA